MKHLWLASLAFVSASVCALPEARAADVAFDPGESVAEPNGASDFTGFGSAGYLLSAVRPVSAGSGSGNAYTGVNPINFQEPGGGYNTSNQLPPSLFTATNLGGNFVQAGGFGYGNEPNNGTFDYIGLGGIKSAATNTAPTDYFRLTFNESSASGYRIAVATQSNGNGNGFNGITLYTGGTSLGTATSSATNSETLSGGTVFYSFDVTNITAGETVTVDLFGPQNSGNLMAYGFTLDALPAIPESRTILSGGAFFSLALWMMRKRINGIFSPHALVS